MAIFYNFAAQREPDQLEIISGIKGALNRQK